MIAERGVEQTSLARIGESAGTSRGLPTHHFGSKDALVARLARRSQDRVGQRRGTCSSVRDRAPEDLSALDVLRTTLATYLELFENPTAEERALIVMWGATFPSQASIDGMLEAEQRSYDGWADLIQRGQQDGSIRRDLDPDGRRRRALRLDARRRRAPVDGVRVQGHEQRPRDVRRLDRRGTRASRRAATTRRLRRRDPTPGGTAS